MDIYIGFVDKLIGKSQASFSTTLIVRRSISDFTCFSRFFNSSIDNSFNKFLSIFLSFFGPEVCGDMIATPLIGRASE